MNDREIMNEVKKCETVSDVLTLLHTLTVKNQYNDTTQQIEKEQTP